MGVAERLRGFDTHSSVQSEFRVYTVQGAVLSIVTVAIILYLVVTEAYFNFQLTLQERVHVNATSPNGLELEFDISLPQVPCSSLNVDANDPTGQAQTLHLDKAHHVWKHRMKNDNGKLVLVGDRSKLELGSTLLKEEDLLSELEKIGVTNGTKVKEEQEEECGSCYGAGDEGECCSTCDDVRRAYKRKGWVLTEDTSVVQCQNQEKEAEGEGCNIHGVVALSTGGGNLHLAPGRSSATSESSDLLQALFQSFEQWNVSHTIHKLRFGPKYPAAVYQLDGQTRSITDSYGMYQYYFQVVPTLFRFRNGTTIQTNQYSVTEHLRHVSPGSGRGLPGVFFFYEVSPLHVEITESYRKGWIAFLTSVCAVVGGVVSVMGIIDQYVFIRRKNPSELVR